MKRFHAVVIVVLLSIPSAVTAQVTQRDPSLIPELRIDALGGDPAALHAGLSLLLAAGRGVHLGGTIAAGASAHGLSSRSDFFGTFSLDPSHLSRWEPYVGGGVTVRYDQSKAGARPFLIAFAGANGPPAGKVIPGLELGLGGGVRIGMTLRRAPAAMPRGR